MDTAVILFAVGGLACLLNLYTSFLRYPLHRLRGGSKESYKWVSGIPMIGSLLVALSLLGLYQNPWYLYSGLLLVVCDTGGLHWFTGVMLFQSLRKKSAGTE